jgi:hypothetical protein
MNVKELRIGNWVESFNKYGRVETIYSLSGVESVWIDTWEKIIGIDVLYPIRLTPELLEACGFTCFKWDKPWLYAEKWERKSLVLWAEKTTCSIFLLILRAEQLNTFTNCKTFFTTLPAKN